MCNKYKNATKWNLLSWAKRKSDVLTDLQTGQNKMKRSVHLLRETYLTVWLNVLLVNRGEWVMQVFPSNHSWWLDIPFQRALLLIKGPTICNLGSTKVLTHWIYLVDPFLFPLKCFSSSLKMTEILGFMLFTLSAIFCSPVTLSVAVMLYSAMLSHMTWAVKWKKCRRLRACWHQASPCDVWDGYGERRVMRIPSVFLQVT